MLVRLMGKGFTLTGVDTLEKVLKTTAKVQLVKGVVQLNGAEMQENAQRRASVDTGFMKRNITLTLEDGGLTATVTSMAEYSAYVNYGTRFMAANPFMTNSYQYQKTKFRADLIRLMK